MKNLLIICGVILCLTSSSCTTTRVVKQPRKVVVVKRPVKYKTVRVNGKKYYVWNGRYHRKTRRGFVVVKI